MIDTAFHDDLTDADAQRLLGFIRRRLVKRASEDAKHLLDDEEGERRVRTIAAVVLALGRITEMEDFRPEGLSADGAAEIRRRRAEYIRAHADRIVSLPEPEYQRELAHIRKLEADEVAAAQRADAGNKNGNVA